MGKGGTLALPALLYERLMILLDCGCSLGEPIGGAAGAVRYFASPTLFLTMDFARQVKLSSQRLWNSLRLADLTEMKGKSRLWDIEAILKHEGYADYGLR